MGIILYIWSRYYINQTKEVVIPYIRLVVLQVLDKKPDRVTVVKELLSRSLLLLDWATQIGEGTRQLITTRNDSLYRYQWGGGSYANKGVLSI